MRRSAARNGRWREVVHRIVGLRLAVVGDDRGVFIVVAEIEPAAALLIKVELVCFLADPRPRGRAGGSVVLDVGGKLTPLRDDSVGDLGDDPGSLFGDRPALG